MSRDLRPRSASVLLWVALVVGACDGMPRTVSPPSCPYTEMLYETECRGAAPSAPPRIPGEPSIVEPPPTRVPICQPCIADTHCTARPEGRCITPRNACGAPRHLCQYPGDPCYPGNCTMNCVWTGSGEVGCSREGPMVPP